MKRNARTMTLPQLLKRWRAGKATMPQMLRALELQRAAKSKAQA